MLHRNQNTPAFHADVRQEASRSEAHAELSSSRLTAVARYQSSKRDHGPIDPDDCEGTHFITGR